MASGTIYGSTSNQYVDAKIEWSSVANIEANTSTVTATLYYRRNNSGFSASGKGEVRIEINGYGKGLGGATITIIDNEWVSALSHTLDVSHNSDGSKSITISATGSISGTTLTSTNVSGTAKLDNIPRASSISRISPRELGQKCYVQWTPLSKDFIFKLKFSLGDWSYTTDLIKPNQTTLYTYEGYTLPREVAKQIPNATKGAMQVILTTYESNGAQVGSDNRHSFEITVPNDADTQPTVDLSVSPLNIGLPSKYYSVYIQGISKLQHNVDAITKYGATVASTQVTYRTGNDSLILAEAGKQTVTATVKDTRGYYGTDYEDIEVLPYQKPYITAKSGESKIIVERCDASENLTNSGTYLKIKAKVAYSKVESGGEQYNYAFIKYRWRKEGGAYSGWQTILNCKTQNSDEVVTAPLLNGGLDVKANYQVQIIAKDDFYESVPITIAVPSDEVYMHRPARGKSMGLGGYSSGDGNLDIHWNTKARGGLSLFDSKGDEIPLGSTMPLPRGKLAAGDNLNALENGVYIVDITLQSGSTVIMTKGVLIQMAGDTEGKFKIQLSLPNDGKYPRFRICWDSTWSDWRTY